MSYLKSAVLGLAMAAALPAAAMAADADVPADSYADMGFYLRGDAGWSWLVWDGHDDSAFVLGGGVGLRYNDYLRGDVRLDWAGDYDRENFDDDLSVTTLLGNLYFDVPTETMFTPYVGAGVGYGWGSVGHGEDKDGFAYALMGGASVNLSDNLSLDLEYRFRNVISSGANPMEHQFMTGIRYEF
jgi:opacity protein-like surface antigen